MAPNFVAESSAIIVLQLRIPVITPGCRIGPVFVQKQSRSLATSRLPGGPI